jgi:hypothetical protein
VFAVGVLGAASLVWAPWNLITDSELDLPAASRSQAEIADLGLEVVVDDGGTLTVVDAFGEVTDLGLNTGDAHQVIGVGGTYVAVGEEYYSIVVTEDGATVSEGADALGWSFATVNGDRTGFAITVSGEATDRLVSTLYDVDVPPGEQKTRQIELASELELRDWGEDYLVLNTDIDGLTTGFTVGGYNFDDSYTWGLKTAAQAGFEVALTYDYSNGEFVCVTDLEPETGDVVGRDTCDFVVNSTVESALAEAAPGTDAVLGYESEPLPTEDAIMMDSMDRADAVYPDPAGRWELYIPPDSSEWILIEADGTESRFEPPAGALFPVMRYD